MSKEPTLPPSQPAGPPAPPKKQAAGGTAAARKYPCVEMTLDVEAGGRLVRLWLDRPRIDHALGFEVISVVTKQVEADPEITAGELAEWCGARFAGVNAAQVIDNRKKGRPGIMIYFEWP